VEGAKGAGGCAGALEHAVNTAGTLARPQSWGKAEGATGAQLQRLMAAGPVQTLQREAMPDDCAEATPGRATRAYASRDAQWRASTDTDRGMGWDGMGWEESDENAEA
jgi:hypothetical protein